MTLSKHTSLRSLQLELKKDGDSGAGSVILILCEDRVRRERALRKLLPVKDSTSTIYYGSEILKDDITKIKDELLSPGLFSSSDNVVIREFDRIRATTLEHLTPLFSLVPAHSVMLLEGTKLPSNNKTKKLLENDHYLLELPQLKDAALHKWIAAELKLQGIDDFSESTISALETIGEGSPDRISSLAEHLSLYLDGEPATQENVFELFKAHPDTKEYALIDALTAGKPDKYEVLLKQLLNDGKNPFLLLNVLARSFSQMIVIKEHLKAGKTAAEIQRGAGIKPWLFNKYANQLKGYPSSRLEKARRVIFHTDSRLKNKSLGPECLLSELGAELCKGRP